MKVICAWCKKDLGEKDAPPEQADEVSHGMCETCGVEQRADLARIRAARQGGMV